jgi:RimJ/RimL family protein N-acetyltransferase
MKIARYGIILDRLKSDKVELLRQWRNAPHIKNYMEFREYITPDMQEEWFHNINNINNHYFLIEYQGVDIGMIHCSRINWQAKTGDSGLFIHDDRFLSTPVSVFASLALLDIFFLLFDLQVITAKVKADNERVVSYNQNLGFMRTEGEAGKTFQTYKVTKEEYLSQSSHLRAYAKRMNGTSTELSFEMEKDPVDKEIWPIVEKAPQQAREELDVFILPD